jgi:hypothetical protein
MTRENNDYILPLLAITRDTVARIAAKLNKTKE